MKFVAGDVCIIIKGVNSGKCVVVDKFIGVCTKLGDRINFDNGTHDYVLADCPGNWYLVSGNNLIHKRTHRPVPGGAVHESDLMKISPDNDVKDKEVEELLVHSGKFKKYKEKGH